MSCRFYKELDVILGGNPTYTAKATVDTSVAHVPVESGPSQERKSWTRKRRGTQRQRMTRSSEMHVARSSSVPRRMLASVGAWQSANRRGGPDMTLGAQPPSLLSPAERLHRIRKRPRRTKEDFLRDVTMRSADEKQELKEWRDSEKRDQKENVARQNEAPERLLKIMERQVDTFQAPLALQTEQLCAHPPLKLFPMHPPDTANTLLSIS
ncbi:uncharacterized protein LOC120389081 [Mauremys reevesii]|uniref:uncharacterized protein LOC120389081 n=1 Tax=Mauremys reevesii TaxID=260615 RepID=UPI00193ED52C|nr:uncharacterized protein LOC120389081 [Mauremys reevesii]